ncbi:hypothetical protein [Lutibaculum baratangense]|uniref:Uncharacterized protein n=1 Tax=Lutibaculum baratangense AMV1 TaxID=631454 RepID=V4TLN5_9HYPH|nr:hypothetical protein [Lutibaculum baratangense]ESR26713.1 hypothetical protein N177_0497 [Lutibaculum baratangense AMV1]
MIDTRWNAADTFETAYPKAPFSELVRLALVLGAALRVRAGDSKAQQGVGGFAGHAAS